MVSSNGIFDFQLYLISEIRARPELWDYRDPRYNHTTLRNKSWEMLATIFGTDNHTIKTKWKSLKDTFRRELVNYQKSGKPSGWTHFKRMLFLKDIYDYKDQMKLLRISQSAHSHSYQDFGPDEMFEEEHVGEDEVEMEIPVSQTAMAVVKTEILDTNDFSINDDESKDIEDLTNNDPAAKKIKLSEDKECTEKMFLLSLLPDIAQMSNKQMREFKMKVTDLVKSILDS